MARDYEPGEAQRVGYFKWHSRLIQWLKGNGDNPGPREPGLDANEDKAMISYAEYKEKTEGKDTGY